MGQSDTLSRRLDLKGVEQDNTNQVVLPVHQFANLRALTTGTLIHLQGDEIVHQIRKATDEYDRKVTALEEASRSAYKKAREMAIWEKNDGLVLRNGLVVVPRNRELQRKIIVICHDGPISGHPGRLKTREVIQQDYWWPGMIWDVNKYVDSCPICPKVKPVRAKPVGELKPMEIPSEPWEIISVDFITDLPKSARCNCIKNVINHHSKLLYSGACSTRISAEGVT